MCQVQLCLSVLSLAHTCFLRTGNADVTFGCVPRSTHHPYGSDRQWHHTAYHFLSSSTMVSRAVRSPMVISSTLPPHCRVLCQVLACWWRGGLKCAPADQLLAARLHVLMRRPGVIVVWSSINISQLHLHKLPERCRVVQHSHFFCLHCDPSRCRHYQKKGCVASVSSDTPRMKKLCTYLFPSRLCLSRVLTPSLILTSDRRPLRRARSRWLLTPGPGSRRTGQLGIVCHHWQDEQTEPTGHILTVDLYWSLAVCLTHDTFNAVARPHSGPCLTYLRSKHYQGVRSWQKKKLWTAIERKGRRRAERGNLSLKRGV